MLVFVRRLLLPLILVVALAALIAPPARASVSSDYCEGLSYKKVVKTYYNGTLAKPLRCGHDSWGFRHIKTRWDAAFDSFIALTIAQGEAVDDLQQDGGTRIYALFNNSCLELFRVIYNGNAYLGNDVSPQGIITAYYSVPTEAIAPATGDLLATPASYRTDCGVTQEI